MSRSCLSDRLIHALLALLSVALGAGLGAYNNNKNNK
jgi:hypothetical protein